MFASHPHRRNTRRILTGLLPLLAAIASTGAGAATIKVTSLADPGTAQDGQCTLREAVQAANGQATTNNDCGPTTKNGPDKIVFADTVVARTSNSGHTSTNGTNNSPENTPLTVYIAADAGQLKITEKLSINGRVDPNPSVDGDEKTVIIDGTGPKVSDKKSNRIFYVQAPATLKNLALKSGHVHGGNGGLILLDTTSQQRAYDLKLLNVVLSGGSASSKNGTGGDGGAIYVAQGSLKIKNSILLNNTADRGGAIWTNGKTLIKNSILGGFANDGNLDIGTRRPEENIILGANTANGSKTVSARGGHIYVDGADLTLIGTVLQNGEAIGNNGGRGGAVFMNGGNLTIKSSNKMNKERSSVFRLNYAVEKGGALVLSNGATADIEKNTVFKKNGIEKTANGRLLTNKGGAIYANDAGKITITASTMTGNQAEKQGGAIWAKNTDITVKTSVLSHNAAAGVSDARTPAGTTFGKGGAIYYTGSQGVLKIKKNSRLIGNRAGISTRYKKDTEKGSGGAIFVAGGEVHITDSTLAKNYARRAGGAIEVAGPNPTVTISRSILGGNTTSEGNIAGGKGGAVHVTGGTVKLIKSTVAYNKSAQGGGLWNSASSTLKIRNSTISHNKAIGNDDLPGNGGGLYGGATITFSTIAYNSAANAGGGVANPGDRVEITNSIVAHNSAPTHDNIAAANAQALKASNSNVIAATAGLDSLQFSGGALVHPLLKQSKAIDLAKSSRPSGADQRGVKCQGKCDAGSFEYRADLPTITVTPHIMPGSNVELAGQSNVVVFAVGLTNPTNAPITVTGLSLEPRGNINRNVFEQVRPRPQKLFAVVDQDGDGMLDKNENKIIGIKPINGNPFFIIDRCSSRNCTKDGNHNGYKLTSQQTLNLLVTLRSPIKTNQTGGNSQTGGKGQATAVVLPTPVYAGGGIVLGLLAILSLSGVRRRTRLLMALGVITIGLTACSNADGPAPPFPTNNHYRLVAIHAHTNSGEVVVSQGLPLNGPDVYVNLQDR